MGEKRLLSPVGRLPVLKSAYIKIHRSDTVAMVNHDKYAFLDEITADGTGMFIEPLLQRPVVVTDDIQCMIHVIQ